MRKTALFTFAGCVSSIGLSYIYFLYCFVFFAGKLFAFRYGSRASPCSTVLATGSEFTHHIGTKSPLHDYARGLQVVKMVLSQGFMCANSNFN